MRAHCVLCGRVLLHPSVFLGKQPVGPKCARNAGLIERARRSPGGYVQLAPKQAHAATQAQRDPKTMELFPEIAGTITKNGYSNGNDSAMDT